MLIISWEKKPSSPWLKNIAWWNIFTSYVWHLKCWIFLQIRIEFIFWKIIRFKLQCFWANKRIVRCSWEMFEKKPSQMVWIWWKKNYLTLINRLFQGVKKTSSLLFLFLFQFVSFLLSRFPSDSKFGRQSYSISKKTGCCCCCYWIPFYEKVINLRI